VAQKRSRSSADVSLLIVEYFGDLVQMAIDTKERCVHVRARRALVKHHQLFALFETPACTENLIRVDDVMESPKLAE